MLSNSVFYESGPCAKLAAGLCDCALACADDIKTVQQQDICDCLKHGKPTNACNSGCSNAAGGGYVL